MVLEARVAKRHSSYQSPPPLPTMGKFLQASALWHYGNMAIWKGWRSLLEMCPNRNLQYCRRCHCWWNFGNIWSRSSWNVSTLNIHRINILQKGNSVFSTTEKNKSANLFKFGWLIWLIPTSKDTYLDISRTLTMCGKILYTCDSQNIVLDPQFSLIKSPHYRLLWEWHCVSRKYFLNSDFPSLTQVLDLSAGGGGGEDGLLG